MSLSKNLYFCIFSSSNLQEKDMGFSILTLYFMFLVLFSWFCEILLVFLSFMGFEHVFVPFVGFGGLGSIDFGYKMLNMFEYFV